MARRFPGLPGAGCHVHPGGRRRSQIVVEAGGETYDYRLDGKGDFKLCESPIGKLTR